MSCYIIYATSKTWSLRPGQSRRWRDCRYTCRPVLEYWSIGVLAKAKLEFPLELVLSLLHYSTTPSLRQTAARGERPLQPLRGQRKARYFGPGFFTKVISVSYTLVCERVVPTFSLISNARYPLILFSSKT